MQVFNVEQVAVALGLHPKTILRHIRSGRLRAAKAGGQWRVRDEDLQVFLGGHREAFEHRMVSDVDALVRGQAALPAEGALQACVIVSYNARDPKGASALAEVFLSAMNADDPERGPARFQSIHDADAPYGRYVLWGRPGFLARVLQQVEAKQSGG